MSEEKKQLDVRTEEFETFVENAINAFEEKVQNNDYLKDIEAFYQLLEKANRWDDLTYYIEEDQLKLPTESSYWMWKIKVAIHNEQFKQVEAWLSNEFVVSVLGIDKVLECTLLCEKEKNRFTQEEVDKAEVVSVYDHPVFVDIERLIDTQNALEEEMKELLLQKAQSDFLRVSPFVDRYFSDGAEWLEMQLQREDLLLSLYENDEAFLRQLKS